MGYKKIGIGKNGKNRYRFQVRILHVRFRHQETCPASVVADLYRRWERDKYDAHGSVIAKHKLFDIAKIYMAWIIGVKSESAVYRETTALKQMQQFLGNMYLCEIKRKHIEEFIAYRRSNTVAIIRDTVAPATLNRVIAYLSCFFNWCINRGYISVNPAQRMRSREANERVIHLTYEQIHELFEKATGIMKRVVILAVFTGMRIGSESCRLKWMDVDLENGYISLWAHATKSKKRRTIPMPDYLLNYLRDVRKMEPTTEYVLSENGKHVGYRQVNYRWRKLREQLSFATLGDGTLLRLHDLRHCYAVLLRMGSKSNAGINLDVIKELLGHSSIAMTLRYAHYQGDVGREKVKALDGIISPPKAM